MEYITKKDYENCLSLIDKYNKHCKDLIVPCAICGEKSNSYVYSILGSYKWYMCENHRTANSYMGGGSMGVMMGGQRVEMKYLDKQHEIINTLADL